MRKKMVDKIDLAIINCLQNDARTSNRELSKEVGLTPPPTLERVRKLWRNGLLKGIRAKIDPGKFGYRQHVMVQISVALEEADNFSNLVKENRYVTTCMELAGMENKSFSKRYLLRILTRSEKEFKKVIRTITKDITVHDLVLYRVKEIHKDEPLQLQYTDIKKSN